MSEFKYACPVCGQHIKCDSSQAGTVMECPTCFQKIVVPQAPTGEDQKFILTGTQVDDKRPTTRAEAAGRAPRRSAKSFPVAAAGFLLALALAIGVGFHFFGDEISQWASHWQAMDIGSVGVPGSFHRQGNTWEVAGSGADIWGQSDGFHFVFRPASGDVSLATRVLGLQNTDPWAKAGLMMRESPAPDSIFAAILVTPSSGVAFQLRSQTGSQATSVLIVPAVHTPCWLRLARRENLFTADYSADGNSWTPMGSTTVPMQPEAWGGVAVTAHNYAALCQASFDHVAVKGGERTGHPKSGADSTAGRPSEDAKEPLAPPASDTNWVLALSGRAIPESPVVGRIHDQDFIAQRASFQNHSLVLRAGKNGSDFAAVIEFGGAPPEELSGKTINVTTNAERAAKVTLHWKDDAGTVQMPAFNSGYALRLQFGTLDNNRLPGKIYLCLPDPQKSYLVGSFEAKVLSPKPRP
ncbi:MAG: hypothetical protein ABSH48_24370 [Verrucomicrobiota bacterium]|jgi:DNA-directed RNA polymerase subunit RPC12/RpoP/regulation of enolase protein 1 (concanavalin A-like superfamily)